MKNFSLLVAAILMFGAQAFAQNVGIGTNTPQTKLQVAGAISSTPTSAQAQAAFVIPDNTSVFRLTAVAGTQANSLSMATPHEGQYLIIYNEDNDAATFSGFTLAGGATMTLNYINSAWRLTARSDAFGPSGTQGPTGPQGNTGPAGATGAQGPQGATGNNGATGSQGVTGPQGNAGPTGAQGTAGTNGTDGKNAYTTTTAGYTQPVLGNNVSVSVVNTSWMTTGQAVFVGGSGGYYVVNSIANSTTVVLTYVGGGGTGTVGATGSGVSASGQTGQQGATGAQGNVGATGPQGTQGIAGPTGAQGTQGIAGPTGAQGTQGIAGPTGAQGTQGIAGPTGAQGTQGIAGPTGAQGPAGSLSAGTAAGNTTYWNGSTWVLNSNNIYNNGGNIGIGSTSPGNKLTIDGTAPITEIRSGGYLMMRPTANGWDMRLNAVGQRMDILSGGDLVNPIATFVHGGNVGIGTATPGWKLDVVGTGRFGANASQNTLAALAVSAGQGAATRFRDIDIHGGWNGGEEHAISFSHGSTAVDLVAQITARHTSPGSSLLFGSLYHSGNSSANTMELRSTSGTTADLLVSGYLNTSDNGSTGTAQSVTGIMVKAGDNYHRTSDAASVRTYLGITAPTGDNLGNHTATTTLSMAGNVISNTPQINMTPGDGNGIRFWSDDNYKIHMGNAAENHYGPVTDYSIKMNMNNQAGRGWTWGVNGVTPVAAIEATAGNMQIKGTFTQGTSGWSSSQIHFSSGWGGAGGYHATIGSGYTGTTAAGIMLGSPHVPWRASYGAKMRYSSDQPSSAYWDLGMNGEGGGAADRFDLNRNNTNFFTVDNAGNVGVGNAGPASKLHVMGKINLHQSGGGGGENRFEGLDPVTSANGRAQFVMSSAYSDLEIASSQVNQDHGSTLAFVTYNPSNAADYRKFVINQGNWGARKQFLDFGYSDAARSNPHLNINTTDQVMSLDGINKRVGIGGTMSPAYTLDVNGKARTRRGGYTLGNANEGQIEISNAASGDAFISFHREGAYGAHFGLASDNWFSTLGWSAGGGYTPIRMGHAQVNGNLQVTGTITGAISVPWSSVTSKPASWLDAANLIQGNGNFNNSVPSGFYEANNAANSPTANTWYNMVNVRHSNTGNDHGFQMAMSFYDENFYSRSYQGGTGANNGSFTPWAKHITNRPGDWDIASSGNSTNYIEASIELREAGFGGAGATPPHLGFHWSGVVASNIAIEADGTIAIRNNPGSGYEKFRCATIRTSGITETSDARLKKDVQPITGAMDAVLKLNGVNYKWKTNAELTSENITYQTNDDVNPNGEMGFIAQEVEKILPQLVNTDKEGFKSMEYSKMVALLVEAYKDLHNEYQTLNGNYQKQQEQLNTLFGQVQLLMQQSGAGNGAASVSSTITK